MKVVYVAGPYTAPDSWQREANIRRAEDACAIFWREGVAAICVHTMSRFFHGFVAEANAITIGLELVRRSDAVYVLHGSERSAGTQAEVELARDTGKRVYRGDIMTCIDWLRRS